MIKVILNGAVVFRNEKDGRAFYRTSIGHKKADGSYENMGITVQFPKGMEPEDRAVISSSEAYLSFYKNKDGYPVMIIFVHKYTEGQNEGPRGISLDIKDQMVFRSEKDGTVYYRTTIGRKLPDGQYENAGVTVRFKKGVELPDRAKISSPRNAVIDFYKTKEGAVVFFIVVFEFEITG